MARPHVTPAQLAYCRHLLWSMHAVHLRRLELEANASMVVDPARFAVKSYFERFLSEGPDGPTHAEIVAAALEQMHGADEPAELPDPMKIILKPN